MIAYYIRSIDGENITLKALVSDYKLTSEILEGNMVYDSCEEKPIILTVKSDELEELASKSQIFGYNPTTKKAKVVDLEEVASMIIAKHKLICNEILDINVIEGCYEEDPVLSLTLQNKFVENENGEMTITITMPQYLEGMFTYYKIDYYEIYDKLVDRLVEESIISNLIYDFKCPQFIETNDLEYYEDYMNMSVVKIRNISFSERFDMSNLIGGGYMFCFSCPLTDNLRYFDTKDVMFDLSKYSADNLNDNTYMFATIEGSIRLPKLSRNTSVNSAFRNKDIDREELLMYLSDLIPYIHDDETEKRCFEKCTFVGITPEEVDKIKKYTYNCYAYILTEKGIGKRVHI